jgi:uncharacterized protein (DUF486 family)
MLPLLTDRIQNPEKPALLICSNCCGRVCRIIVNTNLDINQSVYRERLLEHSLIGELLKHSWLHAGATLGDHGAAFRSRTTGSRLYPIGNTQYSLAQLKIMQEAITLTVFVPFAMFYMNQPFKLDYVWAALCLVGAVHFIFRA